MAEPEARVSYEFGGFRLDPQQRLLSTSSDNRPIPLPPKVFETLLYFVERRGELLEKSTLLKSIWPNVVVEENSLNQNISTLRRVLGEAPGEHRFIATEPGRGYRFVAPVRTVVPPTQGSVIRSSREEPRHESSPSVASLASNTAPARASIAVLPFANLTGDPGKEYFSDGMAEELIYVLARVPGLRVPSRTSAFAYKGRNVDLRQIASDLHVGVVLEGSVRSAGERIRVTAQLIDAESGYHLWAQNYDRKFEDLFELQDALANEIVGALRSSIAAETPKTVPQAPPTHDIEAYRLFLQALAVFQATQFGNAFELLQRALARDPHFGRALALLASIRAQALALDIQLPGTMADTEREIEQAMTLAPDDYGPHASRGVLYTAQGKWIEAEAAFQDAFARDTTSDPSLRSTAAVYLAQSVGHIERSLSEFLETHRLAPAWLVNVLDIAATYQFLGRYDEAAKFLDVAMLLGLSRDFFFVPDAFAAAAMHRGRYEEASNLLVDALLPALRDAGGVDAVKSVFAALAKRDGYGAAIEKLNRLRARVRPQDLTLLSKRRFVLWYTLLGATTEAFDVTNESLDTFGRHGTIGIAWGFMWMREMLPFRQDPRFQVLVARMGMFEYWKRYGPPDNCELRDGKLICR